MDNNLNIKKNCVAVVALSFIGAVCGCGLLLIVQNFIKTEGINLETFIGAGIGLIGICATFLVGLQIWNHLEFHTVKDKIQQIENVKASIEADKLTIEKIEWKQNQQIGDVYTILSKITKSYPHKFVYVLLSITYVDWITGKDENENKLSSATMLQRYKRLKAIMVYIKKHKEIITVAPFYNSFKNITVPKYYPDRSEIDYIRAEILYDIEITMKKTNLKRKRQEVSFIQED